MEDIHNLFKETIAEFMEAELDAELDEEFGYSKYDYRNRGCKSIVWRYISRLEPIGLECHARTVDKEDLKQVVVSAIHELLGDRKGYQAQLQQNISAVIHADAIAPTNSIDEKLMELQQELLKTANSKEAYDEIADEIFRLRELKQ